MAEDYPEILSIECLRRPSKQEFTEEEMDQKAEERTLDRTSQMVLKKAMKDGADTVWDRLERQTPHCKFCLDGISCQRCAMGPCRIMGGGPHKRCLRQRCESDRRQEPLDRVAMGAAAFRPRKGCGGSRAQGRQRRGSRLSRQRWEKLNLLAKEYGISTKGGVNKTAEKVALAMLDEFGTVKGELEMIKRAPAGSRELWKKIGIMPRGIDREVVEAMHRVHMGVGNDPYDVVMHGFRTSMSDGWGGSMQAMEMSDVLFGTPDIKTSKVNLGVMKADHVNVALHGHNPVLSEMLVKAASDPEIKAAAKKVGAKGVNLVGLCCTGNELLMRKGVPQAGNHLDQELAIITGALEAMIVDYQCIFPSLPFTAACYHTKVFSTRRRAPWPVRCVEVTPENAYAQSKRMLFEAIDNYPGRTRTRSASPTIRRGYGRILRGRIKKALGGA